MTYSSHSIGITRPILHTVRGSRHLHGTPEPDLHTDSLKQTREVELCGRHLLLYNLEPCPCQSRLHVLLPVQVRTSRLGRAGEELPDALQSGVVPRLWGKRQDDLVVAQAAEVLDHRVRLVLQMRPCAQACMHVRTPQQTAPDKHLSLRTRGEPVIIPTWCAPAREVHGAVHRAAAGSQCRHKKPTGVINRYTAPQWRVVKTIVRARVVDSRMHATCEWLERPLMEARHEEGGQVAALTWG